MIKKLTIMLAVFAACMAQAQIAVGEWTLHSPFMGIDAIAETDEYVYYTSGSSLCCVDKATFEVQSLNVANRLSDSDITGVYPARDGKSVIIAYASGNMDRIYDNGVLVNLSDIKDALMTGSRTINGIAYGNSNFYVAADFGLVTYDNARNEVRESAMTSVPVSKVFTAGEGVGVMMDNQFYVASQSDRITSVDRLKAVTDYRNGTTWTDIQGDADPYGLMTVKYGSDHQTYMFRIDPEAATMDVRQLLVGSNDNLGKLRHNSKGKVYAVNTVGTLTLDADGNLQTDASVKKSADIPLLSYFGRSSEVWGGSSDALWLLDFTAQGAPAVVQEIGSGNGLGISRIYNIEVASDGSFYLQNMGERLSLSMLEPSPQKAVINRLSDKTFTDCTPVNVHGKYGTSTRQLNYPYRLTAVPGDPDAYLVGSYYEGLFYVKGNEVQAHYFTDNSSLVDYGGRRHVIVQDQKFDKFGNLWVFQVLRDNDSSPVIHMLPADKVGKETTKSDWKGFTVSGYVSRQRDGLMVYGEQSNTMLFLGGNWEQKIIVMHTKGTSSASDDEHVLVTSFVDQDNKDVTFYHLTAAVEDKKGRIWIGTDNGVFEITDPKKLTSSTAFVNHLKVPRNDGTNLADYLLASQMVSDIDIDSSNRKWISTIGSGVYLVSENGDAIIDHYTTDNSILPSNNVLSVKCDPNSNKVYFGTSQGLLEYNSTSSPGQEDYSGVYAYPNPVRPDYKGWITVAGLMENSLVKIADASGNVVHQGRSDGGMFTWDGCNSSGDRVKTGVYFVFASQNATGSNSGAVTKIMVIN